MPDRRQWILFLIVLIIVIAALWRSCDRTCTYAFPSWNPDFPPPAGTPTADIFVLSQNYPDRPVDETVPWTSIDFRTNPTGFADAVLAYCLEGNTDVGFRVENNPTRPWFHVPWLHYGDNGREWRHGLTRERNSRAGELHPNQTTSTFSWAVGFYNQPGGYTLSQVWPECGRSIPDATKSTFPEKTAAFKLLFTTASSTQVPFLAGAYEWTASTGPPNAPRSDHTVLLLQVDIAVKDARAPIGWVFGTYVYDGAMTGTTPWDKLRLVGLAWGNDPTVTSHMTDSGAFINPDLNESFINASLIATAQTPTDAARVHHLGLGGRLNGPIDNPISSCTSCHGKAAVLKDPAPDPIDLLGRMPRVVPRGTTTPADYTSFKFQDFFGVNVLAGSGDIDYNCFVSGFQPSCSGPDPSATFIKTDYSLQVAVGIENYYAALRQRADAFLNAQGGP